MKVKNSFCISVEHPYQKSKQIKMDSFRTFVKSAHMAQFALTHSLFKSTLKLQYNVRRFFDKSAETVLFDLFRFLIGLMGHYILGDILGVTIPPRNYGDSSQISCHHTSIGLQRTCHHISILHMSMSPYFHDDKMGLKKGLVVTIKP